MLNGAGDAGGNIKFGAHGLASLSNLMIVFDPTCIHTGTAGTDYAAEFISKLFDQFKTLWPAKSAAARYDDVVRIQTWIPKIKNSSLDFAHKLYVGDKLIATAESVHVFTNKSGKPVRIPEEIRSLPVNI